MFRKPNSKYLSRAILSYDQGDFNTMRERKSDTNWEILISGDIDIYTVKPVLSSHPMDKNSLFKDRWVFNTGEIYSKLSFWEQI